MAQLPTPPASRPGSEAPEVQKETHKADTSAGLLQTLDTLLERYLHLLDRHQKLQADLAKRLSSGFLSLAHANYTCPPGRRYGADYYDERMKATRKVSLDTSSPSLDTDESNDNTQSNYPTRTFTIEATPNKRDDNEQAEEKETPDAEQSDTGPPSDDNPNPKEENEKSTETEDKSSTPEHPETTLKPKRPRKKFHSSDPITWYGILVPPSLRSAQKSFTEAVDNDIPELATVVAEMQAVEKEVDEVRSQLKSA